MEIKDVLALKTRQLRAERRMSQEEFADEIGISKNILSKIEQGRSNPTLKTLEMIANGFQIPVSAMLTDSEDFNSLYTASLLLSSIKTIQKLDPDYQTLVVRLFEQLVLLVKPGVAEILNEQES